MANIEQKQLQGLKYRTSTRREITVDGKKKIVTEAVERPLQVTDILSATDYGDNVRIVTADGRKHDIPALKPAAGGKDKGKEKSVPTGAGDPEKTETGAGQTGKAEGA